MSNSESYKRALECITESLKENEYQNGICCFHCGWFDSFDNTCNFHFGPKVNPASRCKKFDPEEKKLEIE